ncbi:MAG: hypothetical protein LBJ59_10790 [Zoogloeaceae bacterium]|jgi:hypothetical protein|nr:hypothetical protein [Zoogloeaceae bacterium]
MMNTPSSKPPIALINPGELQRQLAQLPTDDASAALEEITAWLNACQLGEVSGNARLQIAHLLDGAAQPHIRTLTGQYLRTARLSKNSENHLWTLLCGFWDKISRQYEICIEHGKRREKGADTVRAELAQVVTRAIIARGQVIKWKGIRYSPVDNDDWARLGAAYLLAEGEGFAKKPLLQMHAERGGVTSPFAEYLRVLIFQASSLDCLLPQEIELADRLIVYSQTEFVFSAEKTPQSVWWLDAAKAMPPTHLTDTAQTSAPTLRFFHPGKAQTRLNMLAQEIEHSNVIPARLGLETGESTQRLLSVIQHLATCWTPVPPQRQHTRHRVKHRMVVLPGFTNAFIMGSPEFGGKPLGLPQEIWITDNVSQGGFGAIVKEVKGDWLGVGALLTMQPGGEGNWLVGLVRRYQRISEQEAQVGIETLSRRITSVDVGPRASTLPPSTPALWLQDDNPKGDIRFILPLNTFDAGESLEFSYSGRRIALAPVKRLEQGSDYEIAAYRATIAAPPKT